MIYSDCPPPPKKVREKGNLPFRRKAIVPKLDKLVKEKRKQATGGGWPP